MNEFRIVKCKKCDAALTELVGEKLTKCIQCGYSFNLLTDENKFKRPHTLSTKTKESSEYKRYLKKIRNKSSNAKPISNKKKTPVWVTVLKWYFIISFSIGILTSFFR